MTFPSWLAPVLCYGAAFLALTALLYVLGAALFTERDRLRDDL